VFRRAGRYRKSALGREAESSVAFGKCSAALNCSSRRSRDFPSPVWLQATGEMIVLGVNLWPSRAHRVFEFLALLMFQSEFFDQSDGTPIIRGLVAPRSGGSYGLAVDLLGNRSMDHVEV
jgi:hypothetical protein